MENLKPIEPGCMACVVSGEGVGRTVLVIKYVNKGEILYARELYASEASDDGWHIDFNEDEFGIYPESSLLRIDGYDETAQDRLEKSLDRTNDKRIRATSGL